MVHQLEGSSFKLEPGSSQGNSREENLPPYLRKGQHLLWSTLQHHGDLSQVGAALPEEKLLGAADWSTQSPKRLHPALDLQA